MQQKVSSSGGRERFGLALAALFLLLGTSTPAFAERRYVEGQWELPEAVGVHRAVVPNRWFVRSGHQVPLVFRVDPADAERFAQAPVLFDVDRRLEPRAEPVPASWADGRPAQFFWIRSDAPGRYPVRVTIGDPAAGFQVVHEIEVEVLGGDDELPAEPKAWGAETVGEPSPGPLLEDGTKAIVQPDAPLNYAHVYGYVATYDYPTENRRYMLRGIELQLWESGGFSPIKIVHASDSTGEGNCGIDFQDYIVTSTNTLYLASGSNTGFFDFGNVFVGASKSLFIVQVFRYYASSTGTDSTGTLKLTVTNWDDSDDTVTRTWSLGTVSSGDERYLGLYTTALSAGNGTVVDEASHVLFDVAKEYRYFRDCTGTVNASLIARIMPSASGAPSCDGPYFYVRWWDNGYLQWPYTDSIRHEYAHSVHFNMRGGSYPPWNAGNSNHGNCSNTESADALTEGFARWIPALVHRVHPPTGETDRYDWTSSSFTNMSGNYDYCTAPTPDDRHEWAFGRGMWQGWVNAGSTNAYANCTTDSIRTRDPDFVANTYSGIITDCAYDSDLWAGFANNSIDYDTTPPPNPSPINGPTGWTNDNTPTWTWSTPTDDQAGVDGYGLTLASAGSLPSAVKDLEEVTSYTPAALADANSWVLSLRSRDNSGNWNGSYTASVAVGIDTVAPGAVSNLVSTSHTVGVWSTDPNLDLSWTAATDSRSGLDGYGLFLSSSAPSIPGATKDIESVTTTTQVLTASSLARYFNIRSKDNAGNWDDGYVAAGPFYFDDVDPGAVTNLTSTSHTPSVWSTDPTIDFTWTAAPDIHSGVDGYGLFWTTSATIPGASKDIEQVTGYTQSAASSASGHYFNIRAVDHAGNWQPTFVSAGPYYVDAIAPGPVTGLTSSTHPEGGCTTDLANFQATWTAATDAHSGLLGYSYLYSFGSPATPNATIDLGSGITAISSNPGFSSSPRYFNIHARDGAGNWSTVASWGPFTNDQTPTEVTPLTSLESAPEGVRLSWSAGWSSYRIERSTDPAFGAYSVFASASSPWLDASPPVAEVVFYRLKGVNACGVAGP